MTTLLLSDLHLPAAPSSLRATFRTFLAGPARDAQRVYLLGDVFEYWIGDDVGLADYADEATALRALTAGGTEVFFMAGNRDFIVGPRFARATGVQLLDDPVVIELCGQPTLLSHGDLFCTDDLAYQRWRRFSRNRPGLAIFERLPRALRRRIAGAARQRSRDDTRLKPEAILDVNDAAIHAAFATHGVMRLIHGHTHRPAEHTLTLADGRVAERIVLADWRPKRMEVLACEDGVLHRRLLAPVSA